MLRLCEEAGLSFTTTKNLWPQHYVTLAKVLKKIQIKEHWGLIQKKRGALDNEFMKEWLVRFDGK